MADYDFTATRLHVADPLGADALIACDRDQTNYLVNVMRLADGAHLHVFNGRDGEWLARIERIAKKAVGLRIERLLRAQTQGADLWLVFAPLKQARLDYMVQKAVEMGASRLVPAITRYTQVTRVNAERMAANAVEAAEQCGILTLPECDEARPLTQILAEMEADRLLVFCDEDAAVANPVEALTRAERPGRIAVLIGPEGGFAPEERELIARRPGTTALSLGPRILRADTAAVAALAVVQAAIGDWR
ncbi:16S rRNA (uracil(1498)-N(3))-methyltransferase [Phreatobacter aquaticus]|uniref:Ribosomal RNA small subunit methyltransferase E n=1 Tax=Phreatobacter aquaticus TaxID=2570229 RepID=A0A4D7QLP5_9HYPH|nr:16S rRNA (uracil(1498)-N(3))-methyltransferase [Phreatobacter aquaticus]QCK88730.1 16S rRNA (uracil(1498)-N(3))-methyltransferase [Phreatobacter aquaticus]